MNEVESAIVVDFDSVVKPFDACIWLACTSTQLRDYNPLRIVVTKCQVHLHVPKKVDCILSRMLVSSTREATERILVMMWKTPTLTLAFDHCDVLFAVPYVDVD
jgi:hypothetical protein